MAALARHDDTNQEGGTIVSGASTVFVNQRLVAQVGNLIEPHAPWDPNSHPPHENATITSGSSSVFADGVAVAFVGSGNSCGHDIETGSEDVDVG
jgi:uncharacterized Zn-binding protein involved in type VI secretion